MAVAPQVGTIVPVALFSPAQWASLDRSTGRFDLTITNIIGFRIESVSGGTVVGTVQEVSGIYDPSGPGVGGSFVQMPVLTR